MIHNMVINNFTSVHTCTLTIGCPNGDRLGILYAISLGRKRDNRFLFDQELVDETNDLSKKEC